MKKSHQDQIADLLGQLSKQLRSIKQEDFEKLLSGEARLSLRILPAVKGRRAPQHRQHLGQDWLDQIIRKLEASTTREEAYDIVKGECGNKEQLRQLAKHIDLPIPKTDTAEQVIERIVEGTVGYRIRSAAIQGRSRGDES